MEPISERQANRETDNCFFSNGSKNIGIEAFTLIRFAELQKKMHYGTLCMADIAAHTSRLAF